MKDLEKLLQAEDSNDSIIEIFDYIVHLLSEDDCVEKLTEPQRNFYFNQCWEIEVNNGGISQYFFNPSGRYAHQTVDSLKQIGANNSARILQKAIDKFPGKTVPQDDEKRAEILEQMEERNDELWDKLEDRFYDYPDNLNQLNINYIKQHKDLF
jgi:hypothetical protein